MSNLSPRALALYQAHGPGPVDWERLAEAVEGIRAKDAALIEAIQDWASDREGHVSAPSEARLVKALWTYEGDRTQPCDDCDGDCGEPCAPSTVAQAHAALDWFIAEWERKHIRPLPAPPADRETTGETGA